METASVPQEAGAGTATRVPAYRFGIVLLLLLATFIFLASGPTGDWVPLVAVVLQGATLLAAFAASGVGHRLWRLGVVVVLVALVSAAAAIFVSGDGLTGPLFLLNLLFLAAPPAVTSHSLVRLGAPPVL